MGKSLQDQLLNAGLASGQQVKKAKSDKRKQDKLQKNNLTVENKSSNAVKSNQVQKKVRDQQLNQKLQQQAENKAIVAQIRHLIKSNSQTQDNQGDAYHFNDAGKVKSIYVSAITREHIAQGKLAIVKLDKQYHLVATIIAEKLSERDTSYVIQINDTQPSNSSEDPYSAYQIPDDLMW